MQIALDFACQGSIAVRAPQSLASHSSPRDYGSPGLGVVEAATTLLRRRPPMSDTKTEQASAKSESKAQIVERLLKARNGASLAELVAATGWQPHTCRAFLTGLRKKGKVPVRDKRKDGTTFYKLTTAAKTPVAEVESQAGSEANA
jgi:hypothetical protein